MVRDTSIQAYREIKESGLLSKRRMEVYETIYNFGPLTSGEAYQFMERNSEKALTQSRARFTELRDMGVFKEVGKRRCKVTTKMAIVWDVTDSLPEKLEKRQTKGERIKELEGVLAQAIEYLINAEKYNIANRFEKFLSK